MEDISHPPLLRHDDCFGACSRATGCHFAILPPISTSSLAPPTLFTLFLVLSLWWWWWWWCSGIRLLRYNLLLWFTLIHPLVAIILPLVARITLGQRRRNNSRHKRSRSNVESNQSRLIHWSGRGGGAPNAFNRFHFAPLRTKQDFAESGGVTIATNGGDSERGA